MTFWTAVILLTSLMQILVCFARDRVSIIINNSSNSNDICGKVDDIACAIIVRVYVRTS